MAEEAESGEQQPKKQKPWLFLVVCAAVGFISGSLGFATMMMLSGGVSDAAEPVPEPTETVFVKFGESSCNINDGQLNRFLKVNLTLQFQHHSPDTTELEALIDKQKPILKSWLLSYLGDKSMDDIRGAVGQNRLRREIKNHFSEVLFPEGDKQIESLLFEEFIVQ